MKATRRRQRKADPLASPTSVQSILGQLRAAVPDIIPRRDKDLVCLLRATPHIQRYTATDTKRGRPSRWRREDLLKVAARLSDILERETSSHISLASFVDHYLRLLEFPSDVIEALESREINLFEASHLSRVTAERLTSSSAQARRRRADLLSTHLQTKESGGGFAIATHLFFDEIKRLGFALREIRPEDVTDELLEEFLTASEPLWSVIAKIEKRRQPVRTEKLPL